MTLDTGVGSAEVRSTIERKGVLVAHVKTAETLIEKLLDQLENPNLTEREIEMIEKKLAILGLYVTP